MQEKLVCGVLAVVWLLGAGAADAASGGPNAFGYRWNDAIHTYSWIDISGTGTSVPLYDEDSSSALPIGFTFSFYGVAQTQFYIGSNGIITFGSGTSSFSNQCPFNTSAPNNLIALFWADLDPAHGANIFYQTLGSAPNRHLVVQFQAVNRYGEWDPLTAEAILYENGDIVFQYANPTLLSGNWATVGIKDSAGADPLEVGCNSEFLGANYAVLFGGPGCDPITCSTGCCDYLGRCQPGTSDSYCGAGGNACAECDWLWCINRQCTCDASVCPNGCCDAGGCEINWWAACGTGGGACVACPKGTACTNGVCGGCDSPSCSEVNGCCDAGGCEINNTAACGTGGGACVACPSGQECVDGACQCDAASCPTGCCDANGCEPGGADTACGANGALCVACSAGNICTAGSCVAGCDPTDCPNGCCDGTSCVNPPTNSACGANGAACTSCPSGQECVSVAGGGACQCDATSCPAGCCDATGVCRSSGDATCGLNGATCVKCSGGNICTAGSCAAGCDPTDCPTGCCDGQSCMAGTTNSECGANGAPCVSCPWYQECVTGACQCDAASCPTGCCDANGVCRAGTANEACGLTGESCVACVTGYNCQGGHCIPDVDDDNDNDDNDTTDDDDNNDTTDDDTTDDDTSPDDDDDNDSADDDSTPAHPGGSGAKSGCGC